MRNCAGEFLDGNKDNIDKNQMIRTNPTGCGLLWELSGQGKKKKGLGADHYYKTQRVEMIFGGA